MKMTMLSVALVASTGGADAMDNATPESQGVSSKAVSEWIDACERELDALHGFVIVRHGKVVAEGTWAPYDTLNRPHMLYSHSKSFTSTAIGLLVDDGVLDLDERVLDFFPDKAPEHPSSNLQALRIRDLLTMNVGASDADAYNKDIHGDWVKAFLHNEIDQTPGTVFKYDSCATHVLAAIVERKTGKPLMTFLKERLFDPLGMTSPWSTVSPTGVACGGWGMNMTTRDIARFGQFLLNGGTWNDRRILSRDWITLATARQTRSGPIEITGESGTDWEQGYGFQFWRCRHNAFRADGACGQFTIVMPDQDAVVSIHAGNNDMQKEINLVWDILLPAFDPSALPEDDAAQRALAAQCAALALPVQTGTAPAPDKPFDNAVASQNALGFTDVSLSRTDGGWTISCKGGRRLAVGDGVWLTTSVTFTDTNIEQPFSLVGTRDVAASGAWTEPGVLTVKFYVLGAPQHGSFSVREHQTNTP
ncbi:MAG: serine hydrolase domain-containing protein [Kiritimatiellia bacterium]